VPVVVWEAPGVMKIDENGETVFNWVEHIEKIQDFKETFVPNPFFETIVEYNGRELKLADFIRTVLYTLLKSFPQFQGAEDI
jgi:hypothetical protein